MPSVLAIPRFALACIVVVSLAAGSAGAQSLARRIADEPSYRVKFTDDTLTNGLRVLVVQSRFAPVVSAELFVPVGSRADAPGRSGQAHLLEHLTGDTVPDYVRRAGMVFDASTASDLTNYFFIAPVENVDAALFFLATNLRRLEFDSVRLERERGVVIAETGQRSSNQPYGLSSWCLQQLYWLRTDVCHGPDAFERETAATSATDLRDFFDAYYRPDNALLMIVGDVVPANAVERAERYFGDIANPRGPVPPMPTPSTLQRRITLPDQLARAARLDIAYATIAGSDPAFAALNVLSAVLGRGGASVLKRRLVDERKLLTRVETSGFDFRGPAEATPFIVSAVVRAGVDPDTAERAIYQEISSLATRPLNSADVERAKGIIARNFLATTRGFGSRGLAFNLGYFATVHDKPELINTWLDAVDRVTPQELADLARRIFAGAPRVVVRTIPANEGGTGTRP